MHEHESAAPSEVGSLNALTSNGLSSDFRRSLAPGSQQKGEGTAGGHVTSFTHCPFDSFPHRLKALTFTVFKC